MKNRSIFILFISSIALSCTSSENYIEVSDFVDNPQHTKSSGGMVSSGHPLATEAGVKMLDMGGNAVDAAVAAAFTLAVVEPSMSGLGGRMQAIVHTPDGRIEGVDATTQAPMTYVEDTTQRFTYGYEVVGIPGVVKGLTTLLEEYGTLPLATVLEPAIGHAENGFSLLPGEASRHSRAREQILEFPGTTEIFIKSGDTLTYQAGDIWVQEDLAATLKKIAAGGADVFYSGEIASMIARDMAANGAAVTLESLKNYRAEKSEIMHGNYRGIDVYGLWMPSFGAITIEILQILENIEMGKLNEGEYTSAMYQAIALGYEDRFKQKSIEDGYRLTNKEYAAELASKIILETLQVEAQSLNKKENDRSEILAWNSDPGHTTHLSVADKDGMMIALTQSLGPNMGSKVVTSGLGFVYASTLGGYLGNFEPGQRASSHISPMVLTKDGKPYMAIGAAGGSRINTAIVQAICRVIDQDMNLYDALTAPRVHPSTDGIFVEIHDGIEWNPEDFEFLVANGFLIEEVHSQARFGRVHAVRYLEKEAEWEGAADPDWEGTARGSH